MKDSLSNKNVNRVIVFKDPNAQKKLKKRVDLDECWSQVVHYVIDYPKSSDLHLFNKFGKASGVSFATFKVDVWNRGLGKLRTTLLNKKKRVKKKALEESKQLTEDIVEIFQKKRKRKALLHLSRMDTVIDNSTKIIEKESAELVNDKNGALHLGRHLANTTTLHKLASSVYGIDQENDQDRAKQNLAIIMGFNPTPKKIEDTRKEDIIDI